MDQTHISQIEDSPILRTENLTRVVGEKHLVVDISVQVRQGDVIAIFGPSGSGKSSFLRMLNRLDEPTGGSVYFHGVEYRTIPPRELRQRIGMVMQAPNLFPGTVAENIRFGPQQRGEEVSEEYIEMLLSRVGLPGYAGRQVENLSGGEAQRVSLARTLANSPEVLLLDEPTSALDRAAEKEVEKLLLHVIRDENLTCLMVTHDKDQAARIASQVMLLNQGRMVEFGPVEEVLRA